MVTAHAGVLEGTIHCMSAMGRSIAPFPARRRDVRLPSETRRESGRPGSVASCHKQTPAVQQTASLFDDLIGAGEQLWRHCEAERFGGFQIDDKLELRRLHYR
jgi:hypothetical protein